MDRQLRTDSCLIIKLKTPNWFYVVSSTVDPLHVRGNCAANLEDRTIRFSLHENKSQLSQLSQKKKVILLCPPDWLNSHDVHGVYSWKKLIISNSQEDGFSLQYKRTSGLWDTSVDFLPRDVAQEISCDNETGNVQRVTQIQLKEVKFLEHTFT